MNAEILSVGTELLIGKVVDTNATFLSRMLAELGINLYFRSTVGDNVERLSQTVKTALKRSDVVIITGGLGPTEERPHQGSGCRAHGHRACIRS